MKTIMENSTPTSKNKRGVREMKTQIKTLPTWIFDDSMHFFFAIAAFLLLVILTILSFVGEGTLLKVATTIAAIFFTAYLSYEFTKVTASKASKEELRKLGETSGRHIFLLSNQIKELADEISMYVPDGDKSQIRYSSISSQLHRMASQAELSFYDTQRMSGLDFSVEQIAEETRSQVISTLKEETVSCPHCHSENKQLLDTSPSSNLLAVCTTCHKTFNMIRKGDGSVRLTFTGRLALSCPNCHSQLNVTREPTDYGVIIRNCFECYARIKFDLDKQTIVSCEIEEPLRINSKSITGMRGQCPYCSYWVRFSGGRNSRGERLQYCPNCTKLIKVDED